MDRPPWVLFWIQHRDSLQPIGIRIADSIWPQEGLQGSISVACRDHGRMVPARYFDTVKYCNWWFAWALIVMKQGLFYKMIGMKRDPIYWGLWPSRSFMHIYYTYEWPSDQWILCKYTCKNLIQDLTMGPQQCRPRGCFIRGCWCSAQHFSMSGSWGPSDKMSKNCEHPAINWRYQHQYIPWSMGFLFPIFPIWCQQTCGLNKKRRRLQGGRFFGHRECGARLQGLQGFGSSGIVGWSPHTFRQVYPNNITTIYMVMIHL